jgi:hypothetical protein
MSEVPVLRNTRQKRTAHLDSELAPPISAPEKRKFGTSENTENGNTKKRRLSLMSEHTPAQSSVTTITEPAKQYGVYQHYDLSNPSTSDVELIATAPNFSTAYTRLCEHASGEIGSHPTWGATYTRTLQNVYEILDPDNAVRMRYSIDTVIPFEDGWKREREWLAQDYLDRAPPHLGMYVDINHSPEFSSAKEQNFFLGGFTSLGEAKHAMKISCAAYLEQYPSMRIMERCIELVDEKGGVRLRYRIVNGRYVQGRFLREEDWVEKEMGGLARGEEVEWEVKKSDIKRLPTPTPTPTPAPEEPTPAPEEPTHPPALGDPTPALATPAPEEPEYVTPVPEEPTPAPKEEPTNDPEPEPELETEDWCTCHTPDDGTLMICCDHESCPIQWYHGRCIGLTRSPRGKWLCATCKSAKKTTRAKTPAVKKRETTSTRETRAKNRSETPAVRETRATARSQTPAVREGRVEKKTTTVAKKGPKGGRKKKNA